MKSGMRTRESNRQDGVSVQGRFGDVLQQDMSLTIDHPVALTDDRFPDGLGQVRSNHQ